jgi:hypothetical protein
MSPKYFIGGLVLLGALCLSLQANALSIDLAVERALGRDAGLLELQQKSRRFEYLAISDSALPDPEITVAAEGLPIDDPLAADMMTMYRVGIRQRFPAGRSLALEGDRRRSQARAAAADIEARRL